MIKRILDKPHSGLISQLTRRRRFSNIKVTLPGYQVHRIELDQLPKETETNKEELLTYYKHMQTMRRMEIACDQLYKNREIRGFCHLYDGQEAIAMGVEAGVTLDDTLITAYRDHCQQYIRGDTPLRIISELMGKKTGSTKGKGGSMHLYRKKNNFYGGHGIVGAQITLGTGLGFALKYLNKKNCSVTMYGDGASNQGQFFEAINMAYLWHLPVVYICENNQYGMGTSIRKASMNVNFFTRGDLVPGFKVAGYNVLAIREALKFAKQWAINKGPIIIEMDTYRYHGHSMSDPGVSYRTREEISEVRKLRDPIEYVRKLLIDNKMCEEEELKKIDHEIKNSIEDAITKARSAELPDEKSLLEDVLADKEPFFIRGVEYDKSRFVGGKF